MPNLGRYVIIRGNQMRCIRCKVGALKYIKSTLGWWCPRCKGKPGCGFLDRKR